MTWSYRPYFGLPLAAVCMVFALYGQEATLAQSQPQDSSGQAEQRSPLFAPPVPPSTTFTFPGGTLKEYVERINETYDEQVQVLLDPNAEDVRIEPVELKGASAYTALYLLQYLAQLEMDTVANEFLRISAPPLQTRVLSVHDFINQAGEPQEAAMRALISAVEAALELGGHSVPEVKMKLHPDTGLLLVSGTQEQVAIVEQVVSQLQVARVGPDRTVRDLKSQIGELEMALRNLRMRLDQRQRDSLTAEESHADGPDRPSSTAPARSRPEQHDTGRNK